MPKATRGPAMTLVHTIEVIILAHPDRASGHTPYALRGTPVRYERPTGLVAEGEWEAAP